MVNDVTAMRADPRHGRRRRGAGRGRLPDAHAGHAEDDAGRPALRRRGGRGRRVPGASACRAAVDAGIDERRICIDPGIGFGKTVEHNLSAPARARCDVAVGPPGGGRRLAQAVPGRASPAAPRATAWRRPWPPTSTAFGEARGIFRVHDVRDNRDALAVAAAIEAAAVSAPAIEILGLEVFAHHGVHDDERARRPDVPVRRPGSSARRAGRTDRRPRRRGRLRRRRRPGRGARQGGPYGLLERLAALIADDLVAGFPVDAGARDASHKPQAPIPHPFADVTVAVERP